MLQKERMDPRNCKKSAALKALLTGAIACGVVFIAILRSTGPSTNSSSKHENFSVITRQKTQLALLSKVRSALSAEQRSPPWSWSSLFVDKQHKHIYCRVEKVACTNWERTLIELTGLVPNALKMGRHTIHGKRIRQAVHPFKSSTNYTDEFEREQMQYYYKFMFVRDPFERLVSAYRDKILSDRDRLFASIRRQVQLRQQKSRDNESLFTAFVRYILDESNAGHRLDNHWRPQNEICRPCVVNYDFIGHYESLYTDADYVLNILAKRKPPPLNSNMNDSGSYESVRHHAVQHVRFPRSDLENNISSSFPLTNHFLSELTKDDISGLDKLYETDLRLFGYQKR